VLLLLNNGPEYLAAFYGTLLAGGVAVPLPPGVEPSRLDHVMRLCDPEVALTMVDVAARRPEAPFSAARRIVDDFVPRVAQQDPTRHFGGSLPIRGQSPAMILFTSGSSGDPKGVMLSDANLLANARSILAYLPLTARDRALALLPFYHAFGNSVLQTHLLAGATLVMDGSAAFPMTITDALRRHEVTSFSAVPEVFQSLLAHSDLGQSPLPTLRYMAVAGGALAPAAVREVARRIAPAKFFVMYGQTEGTARLAYLPPEHLPAHADSIGQAIPGVTLRVVDEAGAESPHGATGELVASGPNVMLGYWQDPAGTAAVVREGWLYTGDLAVRDEQGLIYLKGRRSALLKVQGIRLHPREIEEVVARRWPACRPIVVPYQRAGATRLALFVVWDSANNGAADDLTVDKLRHHCLRELPRPKVPAHIEIVRELPLNSSLKVDLAALARRAEAGSD
jgi:acyl-CoA synthetase (AMP-forming)/AMP-acid ligase II